MHHHWPIPQETEHLRIVCAAGGVNHAMNSLRGSPHQRCTRCAILWLDAEAHVMVHIYAAPPSQHPNRSGSHSHSRNLSFPRVTAISRFWRKTYTTSSPPCSPFFCLVLSPG